MWIEFLHRAFMRAVPLLFGSTGEIVTEKSGNLNLGIPGVMYVGGIGGVIGAFLYEQNASEINPFLAIFIPVLCSLICSLLKKLFESIFSSINSSLLQVIIVSKIESLFSFIYEIELLISFVFEI